MRPEGLRAAARRLLLRSRPHAYCSAEQPLTVLVGTWNVNGREPPSGVDLRPWLTGGRLTGGRGGGGKKLERLPDIVAITFQEVVPLSAANVLLSAASGGEAWEEVVADALERLATEEGEGGSGSAAAPVPSAGSPPKGEKDPPSLFFTPVARRQMVGVSLLVFARTSLVASGAVRGAQTLAVGTGGALPSVVGGGGSGGNGNESDAPSTTSSPSPSLGLGNKGAVAARLLVHSATPLVFVGAHLPSGDSPGDAARRDATAAEVLRRGHFPSTDASGGAEAGRVVVVSDEKHGNGEASSSSSSYWPSGRCQLSAAVADADASFFAGDLNYRVLARADAARRALKSFRPHRPPSPGGSSSTPTSSSSPLATLLALDELKGPAAEARGACPLSAWEEGAIGFAPTYKLERFCQKYQGGEDDDDASDAEEKKEDESEATATSAAGDDEKEDAGNAKAAASAAAAAPAAPAKEIGAKAGKEKTRTPSWTDRVLFRCHPSSSSSSSSSAKLLWYASSPGVLGSDHRPVSALFEVAARKVDPSALAKAVGGILRDADAAETRRLPRCSVVSPPKGHAVDFGTLKRGSCPTAARSFVLRNESEGSGAGNGGGVARWSLAPLPGRVFCDGGDPERARLAPLWLAVCPVGGVLLPGESVLVRCVASPFGACSAAAASAAAAAEEQEEEERSGGGGGGADGGAAGASRESDFGGARGSLSARPPRVAADAIAAAADAAAKATRKHGAPGSGSGQSESEESGGSGRGNSFPLEAVVVVRVEGGNDEFVSFKGSVEASWWGLGLERLSGMPRPMSRSRAAAAAAAAAGASAPPAEAAAAAPAAAAEEEKLPPLQPPATLAPLRTSSNVVAAPSAPAAAAGEAASETGAASGDAGDGSGSGGSGGPGGGLGLGGPDYSSGGEFYSPASSLASNCSSVAGGGGSGNPGSASGSPLSASGLAAGATAAAAAFPRGGSRLGPNGGGERQLPNGTPLSLPPQEDALSLHHRNRHHQQRRRSSSPLPPTPKAIQAEGEEEEEEGGKEKEEESAAAKPPSPPPPAVVAAAAAAAPVAAPTPLPPPQTPSTPMPLLVPSELERLISFLDDALAAGSEEEKEKREAEATGAAAALAEREEGREPAPRQRPVAASARVTPSLFVHAAGRARRAALSGAVASASSSSGEDDPISSFSSSSFSSPCLDDIDALRSLLDSQLPLPARFSEERGGGGVHPAAAAATLLAFLLLLPRPLLPARAAALCDGAGRAPAPDAARDLLTSSMLPSEWATLGAVAGLASRVVERAGRDRGEVSAVAGVFPSARTPLPALLAEFLLPATLNPCSGGPSAAAASAAAAATAAAGGVVVAAEAPLSSLTLRDGVPRRFSASGGGLASPELARAAAAALAAVADAADAAASARAELVATVIDRAREWWPAGGE